MQHVAAGAFWHLGLCFQQNKAAILAADAAPLLVSLLRSDYVAARLCNSQRQMLCGAWQMASTRHRCHHRSRRSTSVDCHAMMLDAEEPNMQVAASKTLEHLANGSQENKDAIIAAGYTFQTSIQATHRCLVQ